MFQRWKRLRAIRKTSDVAFKILNSHFIAALGCDAYRSETDRDEFVRAYVWGASLGCVNALNGSVSDDDRREIIQIAFDRLFRRAGGDAFSYCQFASARADHEFAAIETLGQKEVRQFLQTGDVPLSLVEYLEHNYGG
jgi:hypothetical protein